MKTRTRLLVALLLCALMVATSLIAMIPASAAEGDLVTDYGTVPADQAGKAFAVFQGEGKNAVGCYDSWKDAVLGAKALMDASTQKVTILQLGDYVNNDGFEIPSNLAYTKGNLLIDLNNHTFTVAKGHFLYLRTDAANAISADALAITVKNGTVLQGMGYILDVKHEASPAAKDIDVTFNNVKFGYHGDYDNDSYEIFFRIWGGSGNTASPVTVDLAYNDCTFDFTDWGFYENPKYPTLFMSQDKGEVTESARIKGGNFIIPKTGIKHTDNKHYALRFSSGYQNMLVEKDANGNYPTFTVPNGVKMYEGNSDNQLSTPEGKFYPKMLIKDGTDYDVYTLPTLKTEYGTIPSGKAYERFAIFMNGKYQAAFGDWNAVWYRTGTDSQGTPNYDLYVTVHKLLRDNPGAKIVILVRQWNGAVGTMADQTYLGHLAGGEITVDLGGNTVIANSDGFLKIGLAKADYDAYMKDEDGNWLEKYGGKRPTTNLTVKNGTLLQGAGYFFYVKNGTTAGGASGVTFDGVTFGFDNATVLSNHDIVFRGWGGTAGEGYTVNSYFKNCTFDVTGFPLEGIDYPQGPNKPAGDFSQKTATWFYDGGNATSSVINYVVDGGQFIIDTTDRKMTVANSNAADTTTFVNTSGSYTTFSVPNGSTWQNSQKMTIKGAEKYTYTPKMLVKDGTDYDVYTLPEVVTPYGVICSDHAYTGNFAVFCDGECQVTVNDWAAAWYREPGSYNYGRYQSVLKLLFEMATGDKETREVQVYVRYDVTAGNMLDAGTLGHMAGGNVLVDLGGHTVVTGTSGFFKIGLFDAANDQYLTDAGITKTPMNVTVKNGTLLQGKGTIFSVKNTTADGGTANVTFDGVTVGYDTTVIGNNDIIFRGWGADYDVPDDGEAPGYTVNAYFKNCTFDSRVYEGKNFEGKKATWFYDDGSATSSVINYVVDGGRFISNDPTRLTIVNDNAKDTALFVNTSGEYATLEVPNGATYTAFLPTNVGEGEASFTKLLVDGADRDVYGLQFYEKIDAENLMYVVYNGKKLPKAPYHVPMGADYVAVCLDPDAYVAQINTEDKNSIRLGTPAGLRFATRLSADFLAQLEEWLADGLISEVAFGTLVAPESYAKDNGFTVAELEALGRQYLDIKATYGHYFNFDKDETTTHFVGSVVNLKEASVTRNFLGRGYAKITLNSGESVMIYSAYAHVGCVQTVATEAQKDNAYYPNLSAENQAIIDAYAAGVLPEIPEGSAEPVLLAVLPSDAEKAVNAAYGVRL